MSNTSQVADHPGRLDRLGPVFARRRIVMAVDGDGNLVLLRPDSVVVDAGGDDASYRRAVAAIRKVDPDQGAALGNRRRRRGGLVRFELGAVEPIDAGGERRWSAGPIQDVISRLRDAGARAEANHVVLASQGVRGFPVGAEAHYAGGMMFTADIRDTPIGPVLLSTSEPAPPPHPSQLRQALHLDGHTPPRVLVLDTGLRTDGAGGSTPEHPELSAVVLHTPWHKNPQPEAIDDEDEADDDASGSLDFEGGHGTFISGIIRQICPDAEVHIAGVLSSFGDGDVDGVVAAFERVLGQDDPFDVVVMSLGGYMTEDDGSVFGASLARLLGDGLGVAAAGNQATCRRYFPAALADIVGVGALGEGGKAWFTNFGGWVDACAPGIDVVSTFFTEYDEQVGDNPGRSYRGWARWSGTSFSAPKVAAAIAQEMYLTGATAREAWKRLSNHQRYRVPDVGVVFNI